jgi:hypothetical protein
MRPILIQNLMMIASSTRTQNSNGQKSSIRSLYQTNSITNWFDNRSADRSNVGRDFVETVRLALVRRIDIHPDEVSCRTDAADGGNAVYQNKHDILLHEGSGGDVDQSQAP